VGGFAFGRFYRFYFSATSPDYFRCDGETHGPVRVRAIIDEDKSLTMKILTSLFRRDQAKV
jgi:hypothetical protein